MIKANEYHTKHVQNVPDDPSMKGPLIASGVFHVLLFVLTAVGMPFVVKEHKIISTPLSVEIVEIDKKTTTKEPIEISKPVKAEKKPAPPKKEEAPPKQDKPAKPVKMDAPEPPRPDALESVSVIPKAKPNVPPIKKPKPEEKKPEKPKKDFHTLLKNLAPDSPEEPEEKAAESASSASQVVALDERVTMSEMDALRRQLAGCWNIPSGAKYAEQLVVEVRLTVNPDRTVQSASILDKGRYNRDSYYRAAADAALRALRNPKCSPLALPPEKYNQWKVMTIGFDPSQML